MTQGRGQLEFGIAPPPGDREMGPIDRRTFVADTDRFLDVALATRAFSSVWTTSRVSSSSSPKRTRIWFNTTTLRTSTLGSASRREARRVQEDGTCWLGGSTWHGKAVVRISVSNWSTTEADADMSGRGDLALLQGCKSRNGRLRPSA